MTSPVPAQPGREDEVLRLLNECMDAEGSGDVRRARSLFRQGCAMDAGFSGRLELFRRDAGGLALPPASPDFTGRVLAAAEERRPFSAFPSRRRVTRGRAIAGAACLALIAGYFAVSQVLSDPPSGAQPIGSLVAASRADVSESFSTISGAMDDLRRGLAAPVREITSPPVAGQHVRFALLGDGGVRTASTGVAPTRRRLSLGDTSRYGLGPALTLPDSPLAVAITRAGHAHVGLPVRRFAEEPAIALFSGVAGERSIMFSALAARPGGTLLGAKAAPSASVRALPPIDLDHPDPGEDNRVFQR